MMSILAIHCGFFVLFYFVNCFMPYVLCFVRALVHVQLQFDIKLKDMRKLKDIYDKKCKKNTKILPEFCNNNNSKESEDYCKKSSKMRIIIIAAMLYSTEKCAVAKEEHYTNKTRCNILGGTTTIYSGWQPQSL